MGELGLPSTGKGLERPSNPSFHAGWRAGTVRPLKTSGERREGNPDALRGLYESALEAITGESRARVAATCSDGSRARAGAGAGAGCSGESCAPDTAAGCAGNICLSAESFIKP